MITQCYKWSQVCQRSKCWNTGRNGLACHSQAVCKAFPRLLSGPDCQASPASHRFAQGRLSRRHACLCVSSRGTCLQSHSPTPQAAMLFSVRFACVSLSGSTIGVSAIVYHPLAPSVLCTQLLQLLGSITTLFPFLRWLFKKAFIKNYVPSTVLGTKWTKQTWYLTAQGL